MEKTSQTSAFDARLAKFALSFFALCLGLSVALAIPLSLILHQPTYVLLALCLPVGTALAHWIVG